MGQRERHPPGLYVLFFTEMWERFGFYSMLAMFTLYLRNEKEGFGWTVAQATTLYSNYLMFVYASPLIGGWIADKGLGYRNSVLLGGLIFMVGYFLLAFHSIEMVYAALVCLVIGNGFFKPNVSAMVGHLYPEGSTLKDRAYNIFYMGINVGALLAPINAEIWVDKIGFNWAFAIAGFGMIISVAILWSFKHHVEGAQTKGMSQLPLDLEHLGDFWINDGSLSRLREKGVPGTVLNQLESKIKDRKFASDAGSSGKQKLTEALRGVLSTEQLSQYSEQILEHASSAPAQPGSTATPAAPPPVRRFNPIDAVPDSTRITALIVIFLIVIVFWMIFHQNGSTLTYWADDNTNWKVSGIISNAINPFWVVTLTFPLVWFWRWLDSKGLEPSTPTKMALGMVLTAVTFGILYSAARIGETGDVPQEAYATGDFRVTERSLNYLKADGVPEEDVKKLDEAKDANGKFIVKGRKFSTDETSKEFLETIKQDLKSQGVSGDAWKLVETAEFDKGILESEVRSGQPGVPAKQFAEALKKLVADLKKKGLPDDVADKMLSYENKNFTGEDKLLRAAERVLGPERTSRDKADLLRRTYLFKMSPFWLILAYAVVTLAELMLSPMGLSLVSKVAPVRMRGLMMGGWFVATAIGNKLTMIGVFWDRWLQSSFFALLAGLALATALVLVALLRPLKKAMPGV